MELQLISGRFTKPDAEQLLKQIFAVKINFHESRIRTSSASEDDIKHSEKRIIDLQHRLRSVVSKLHEHKKEMVDINAFIEISFAPQLTP